MCVWQGPWPRVGVGCTLGKQAPAVGGGQRHIATQVSPSGRLAVAQPQHPAVPLLHQISILNQFY